MAGAAGKTLKGCGIGCGVLLLILIVVGAVGLMKLKRTFEPVVEARDSYEELIERHGAVEDYVPAPDGSIPADRMELFLAVRDSLAADRERLHGVFADFPPDEVLDEERVWRKVLGAMGAIGDLIPPIGAYAARENRLLLDTDMGYGEYFYIYSLAFFSWLGNSPEAGPVVTKRHPEVDRGDPIFDGADSTFGPRETRRRYHRFLRHIVENQLEALDPGDPFHAELEAELSRFRRSSRRVLWEDGLPEAIERSLEPYRDRLEPSWDPAVNPFQMPMEDEDWKWQLDSD